MHKYDMRIQPIYHILSKLSTNEHLPLNGIVLKLDTDLELVTNYQSIKIIFAIPRRFIFPPTNLEQNIRK